jgi:hypothetical protein
MKERTADDIVQKKPLTVTLGATDVQIPILTIGKARVWRELYLAKMDEATKGFTQVADQTNIGSGLTQALLGFPDVLLELVHAYCPTIDTEWAAESATDEQIVHAFSAIMVVAFPYWGQLKTAIQLAKNRTA